MRLRVYDKHLFLIMANRVLIGDRSTGGMGLYVSRSGEDVLSASNDDLLFWTPSNESGSSFISAGHLQSVPVSGGSGGVAPTVSSSTTISSGSTASVAYQNNASSTVMLWGARPSVNATQNLGSNMYKYSSLGSTSATLNNNGTQSQTIKTVTFNLINSAALF